MYVLLLFSLLLVVLLQNDLQELQTRLTLLLPVSRHARRRFPDTNWQTLQISQPLFCPRLCADLPLYLAQSKGAGRQMQDEDHPRPLTSPATLFAPPSVYK